MLFVAHDAHGEPTLYRHAEDGQLPWVVLRRSDVKDLATWASLVTHVQAVEEVG